jgi:FkbM family methyltransferase
MSFRKTILRSLARPAKRVLGPERWLKVRRLLYLNNAAVRYDVLTVAVMRKALQAPGAAIDVGAHAGEIMRLLRFVSPQVPIVAFEPLPDHYEKLVEAWNGVPGVRIFNAALSDREEVREFTHVVTNPAYSGFRERKYERSSEETATISVTTRVLDDVLGERERIAFVKIDVEGAELEVLRGAVRTLSTNKPVVVFEHGLGAADRYETTPEQVFDLLNETCGLRVFVMESWLRGGRPESRTSFGEQFRTGKNYYFVAAP